MCFGNFAAKNCAVFKVHVIFCVSVRATSSVALQPGVIFQFCCYVCKARRRRRQNYNKKKKKLPKVKGSSRFVIVLLFLLRAATIEKRTTNRACSDHVVRSWPEIDPEFAANFAQQTATQTSLPVAKSKSATAEKDISIRGCHSENWFAAAGRGVVYFLLADKVKK